MFPLQDRPVFYNLFGTYTQPHKGDHNNRHKDIRHKILVSQQSIFVTIHIPGKQGNDQRQQRSFEQRNCQILLINQFCPDIPFQENTKLFEPGRFFLLAVRQFLLLNRCIGRTRRNIFLVPFFRCKLPDVRLVSGVVDLLRVDNIQNQFRIHIPAGTANADIRIGIFRRLFEINNRFDRISVINGITSPVQ